MDGKVKERKLKVRKDRINELKAYFVDFLASAGDCYVSVLASDPEEAVNKACKIAGLQWKVGMSASPPSRIGRVYFIVVSYSKLGGKRPGSTNSQVQTSELQVVENVSRETLPDGEPMYKCANCGLDVHQADNPSAVPEYEDARYCDGCYIPF